MSPPRRDQPLSASLLDRLMEGEDGTPRSGPPRLSDLKNAVRRDMEMLLNSHCRCMTPREGQDQLAQSVVSYGIPDFTGLDLATEESRDRLVRHIEETIRRFEPRFLEVHVSRVNNSEDLDRTLRLRIEALMHADPAPEPLVLSSQFDPTSSTFEIVGSSDV